MDAFKREAVERVRMSGMTIIAVTVEKGLREPVLRQWIARSGKNTRMPPAVLLSATAPMPPSPADLAAKNAHLERELRRAEAERYNSERAALVFGGTSR